MNSMSSASSNLMLSLSLQSEHATSRERRSIAQSTNSTAVSLAGDSTTATTTTCEFEALQDNRKSVKFGGLVIREHKLEMSDLPWRNGPPITLSWEQICLRHVDLEEFERSREGERRLQKDLWTSAADRRCLLKEQAGYSDRDLMLAERIKKAIQLSSRGSSSSRKQTWRVRQSTLHKTGLQSEPCNP